MWVTTQDLSLQPKDTEHEHTAIVVLTNFHLYQQSTQIYEMEPLMAMSMMLGDYRFITTMLVSFIRKKQANKLMVKGTIGKGRKQLSEIIKIQKHNNH